MLDSINGSQCDSDWAKSKLLVLICLQVFFVFLLKHSLYSILYVMDSQTQFPSALFNVPVSKLSPCPKAFETARFKRSFTIWLVLFISCAYSGVFLSGYIVFFTKLVLFDCALFTVLFWSIYFNLSALLEVWLGGRTSYYFLCKVP